MRAQDMTALLVYVASLLASATAAPNFGSRAAQEEYLKRFNHLGVYNPDPRMAALRTDPDAQFALAIKNFQRFAGLNVTGNVDGQTIKMMQTPRCGVADVQDGMTGVASRRRRRRYTAPGHKWKQMQLTYQFMNYSRDMAQSKIRQDITKAFQLWSDVSPLTFAEVSNSALADIEISFHTNPNHGDDAPFDGPGGTLAHAYFPGRGIGGDVHFDDSETYTTGTNEGTNLLQVATHELGHSLGLGHSENQNSIMAPFYRGYKADLKLDTDDILGITYLYGQKVVTKTPPKTTTTTTPKTPDDGGDPVLSLCRNPVFDAIDVINGTIHAFYGDKYVQLEDSGKIRQGFPKFIRETFPILPAKLDAVLSLEFQNGVVYFFKGHQVYVYNSKLSKAQQLSGPYLISQIFTTTLTSIDAAFVWSGNGRIYFVKGNSTYRYDQITSNYGYTYYPQQLSYWTNLPSSINDAFWHRNGKTYFFSGRRFYIFNDREFKVESVDDTYEWMRCCSFRVQYLERMQGLSLRGASPSLNVPMQILTLVTVAVVSMLALPTRRHLPFIV